MASLPRYTVIGDDGRTDGNSGSVRSAGHLRGRSFQVPDARDREARYCLDAAEFDYRTTGGSGSGNGQETKPTGRSIMGYARKLWHIIRDDTNQSPAMKRALESSEYGLEMIRLADSALSQRKSVYPHTDIPILKQTRGQGRDVRPS